MNGLAVEEDFAADESNFAIAELKRNRLVYHVAALIKNRNLAGVEVLRSMDIPQFRLRPCTGQAERTILPYPNLAFDSFSRWIIDPPHRRLDKMLG